jgi:thiol-disulfide isomerase/thioredoxin
MSSKSIIASSWRTGLVALGLVLLVTGGYGLYAREDASRAETTIAEVGETPDRVTRELSTGTLTAFVVHPEPKTVGDIDFVAADQTPLSLADWKGRVVLVNLWATWCGPCREEMPALAELQRQLGSEDFEVVAISLDRQGAEVARPFLENVGAEALELYLDPSTKVLVGFKAVGLPASILIDRAGREVGRMFGPADWASPEAVRLIKAALAEDGTTITGGGRP